ncbi:hypothetical protein [Ensifer aridi]|uniref:hypothetical protein n=1 Tax=Ensifer aridi TaxID=1708715 RepID=UPI00111C59C3|nr:hypothetical protein [Ensifer aridi]
MIANIVAVTAAIWIVCSCALLGYAFGTKKYDPVIEALWSPKERSFNQFLFRVFIALMGPVGVGLLIADLEAEYLRLAGPKGS